MAPAIRAEQLTKFYGRRRGVLELSFEVERGEVFGFLGPNGAGKTTTIRLMLDLLRPTSGRVELLGADPRRDVSLRRRIGYLPGDLRLYERLTPEELFRYFASLRGLDALGAARSSPSASSSSSTIRSARSRAATSRRRGSSRRSCTVRTCSCSTSRPQGSIR